MENQVMTMTASGNRCPKTGRYQSFNDLSVIIELKEGQAVPVLHGKVSYWKLIEAGQN
jgi:hypothetical protein